jgi:hypothetical protein
MTRHPAPYGWSGLQCRRDDTLRTIDADFKVELWVRLPDRRVLTVEKRPPPERRTVMGIGASVFLIAVGAILTFALNLRVSGLNLDIVGWILMAAGLIGLVATIAIWGNRRRTVVAREPTGYRRVEERTDTLPPEI